MITDKVNDKINRLAFWPTQYRPVTAAAADCAVAMARIDYSLIIMVALGGAIKAHEHSRDKYMQYVTVLW